MDKHATNHSDSLNLLLRDRLPWLLFPTEVPFTNTAPTPLPCINHSCSISTDKSPQQIGVAFILKVTVPRLLSLSSLSSKKDSHHWLTGIMGSTLQHNDCSQSCLRGQAEAGLQTRPCARLALSSTLSFSFLISYFFFILKTTPNSQQNICMRAPGLP